MTEIKFKGEKEFKIGWVSGISSGARARVRVGFLLREEWRWKVNEWKELVVASYDITPNQKFEKIFFSANNRYL